MSNLFTIEKGIHISSQQIELLGGKAHQQAVAAADGLPILNGVVLTTEIFPGQPWLEGQANKSIKEQAESTKHLLNNLGIDLTAALKNLPSQSFAVRSSANAEDLETASFAGSFTTKLNIPPDDIYSAIYEVWASTFSPRLRQYLIDRKLDDYWHKLRMAILIQPMVNPLLSGVALSHPLGKINDPLILVTAIRGLGERLVSGEAEPQTFFLERGTWAIVKQQDALDAEVIYEVSAEIGRTIEFLELQRGLAQDIEFAIDSTYTFILLQNRPIALRQSDSQINRK
jgi:rifampicin phosphotransferase